MRRDPPLPISQDKSPRDRFVELGMKLMAVSKAEIVALEKKWQSRKRRQRKTMARGR